jgi:hypothetical protein
MVRFCCWHLFRGFVKERQLESLGQGISAYQKMPHYLILRAVLWRCLHKNLAYASL